MTVMDDDEYQKMVKRCLRCSICKWIPQLVIKSKKYATVCPAIDMYNFHSYSGGGKIILANSLARGRIKPTEELRDLIYKCTECGGCAIACKYLNTLEPLEIITRLREILVESGYGPMPKQQEFIDAVKSKHNPYNE
ncbi:MAG: 4Fe-4S dicluster domain-containing protein, partial [Candidatus Hodarchaeota archaeon]